MAERQKLLTRNMVLLFFARALSNVVFTMSIAAFPTYVILRYGAEGALTGFAGGAFALGIFFGRIVSGGYMDRLGRRRSMYATGILCIGFTLVYQFAMPIGLFLVLLVIHGLLHGMFANIIMAASTDLIPKERLGEGLGWLSLAITISMGLGPYLGLWALQDNNYSLLFFLCTGFMVVGVFCTFFLDKGPIDAGQQRSLAAEAETAAKSGPVPGWKRLLQHFFEKSAVPGAILIFLLTICSTSVNSFLSPFAVERGFGEAAQWYFAVYSIMLLITRPATGKLMDKYGDKVVIYPMMALFIVALLVIANMQGPAWIIAAAVLMAFGFGAQFPVLQAIAVRKSMGARVGVATSTFFVLSDFATGMGPAMTGALVPYMGYAGMYLFCVAIVVAAILFYTFVATKQQ